MALHLPFRFRMVYLSDKRRRRILREVQQVTVNYTAESLDTRQASYAKPRGIRGDNAL